MTPRAMKLHLQDLFCAPECNFEQWPDFPSWKSAKIGPFLKLQSQFYKEIPSCRGNGTQNKVYPSLAYFGSVSGYAQRSRGCVVLTEEDQAEGFEGNGLALREGLFR